MAEEEAEIPQEGEGSFMFPDRSTYTGSWKLNADGVKMRHGRGVFDDGARQRYEGEWADDCMHGRGTFEYASGARYEGEFVANKYDGYGTFTFANGAFYEGTFKDNQFHGTGTFTDAQKTTWKGKVRRPAAHLPVSKRAVLASIHGFDSRARLPLRAVLQRNGSWFDARLRRRALERLCWLLRPEPTLGCGGHTGSMRAFLRVCRTKEEAAVVSTARTCSLLWRIALLGSACKG